MLWPTETYERQRIKFNDSSFIQMEGCEIEWFYFPLFSCSFQICFHCMKTKFGLFYRGHSCEMCKQTFCTRCHTKVSNSFTVVKQQDFNAFLNESLYRSLKKFEDPYRSLKISKNLEKTSRKKNLPESFIIFQNLL